MTRARRTPTWTVLMGDSLVAPEQVASGKCLSTVTCRRLFMGVWMGLPRSGPPESCWRGGGPHTESDMTLEMVESSKFSAAIRTRA